MARSNPRISIIRFIFTFTLPSQAFPPHWSYWFNVGGISLSSLYTYIYILLYIYYIYVVYSCLFHSLYSLYHWLSKPLFWPAHLIFSTSSTPRLSSHPHLPVSTSGLPLCRLQKTATSQPSTIHQPSTSHPSAIHQRRRGLSSEIFATANGFCQEGMTVLSAEAAVPFLGDLSRWGWDGGLRWRMMGFMAEPWENHRKTIGNLGKILCKWRFLAGKYHRTMACGQVDDQRVNCVIFRCFCFFVVSVLNNHKNFYVFVRLGFGWWILYLKWGYQLTMVLQLKWVARKVELVFIDSGYWHVFNVDTGQAVLQKWCMLFRSCEQVGGHWQDRIALLIRQPDLSTRRTRAGVATAAWCTRRNWNRWGHNGEVTSQHGDNIQHHMIWHRIASLYHSTSYNIFRSFLVGWISW